MNEGVTICTRTNNYQVIALLSSSPYFSCACTFWELCLSQIWIPFLFLVLGTTNVTSNAQATSLELNSDSICSHMRWHVFFSWTTSFGLCLHKLVIFCWTTSLGPLDVEADTQARTWLIHCQLAKVGWVVGFQLSPRSRTIYLMKKEPRNVVGAIFSSFLFNFLPCLVFHLLFSWFFVIPRLPRPPLAPSLFKSLANVSLPIRLDWKFDTCYLVIN